MDLTPYVENLRRELAVAAEAGGEDARALAERLTAPLESAIRLMLLDALSAAADEITRELAPGSVELRLRAGEPEFVVTPAPADEPVRPVADAQSLRRRRRKRDEGATARINLRLPEQLKAGVEQAAGRERLSVNAWLVRAAAAALAREDPDRRPRAARRPDRPDLHRLGALTAPPKSHALSSNPTDRGHLDADLRHPRTDLGHDRPRRRRRPDQRQRPRRHRRRGAPQRRLQRRGPSRPPS